MIGSEGLASASENRASELIRARACYRLRLTHVHEPQSTADSRCLALLLMKSQSHATNQGQRCFPLTAIGRVRDALVCPRKRQLFPMLPGSAEPAPAPVAKWPWTEDRGVVVDVSAMQVLLEKGLGQKRHPLLIWSQRVISGTGLPRVDVVLHDNLVVLMEMAAECSQREIFEDLAR